MRSLLIEFQRFNDLKTGILRNGDQYLVAVGAKPMTQFTMPLDHKRFLRLMHGLRYQAAAAEREASLKEIAGIVTTLLGAGPLPGVGSADVPVQLDLVVNAAELAALPFEAVMDAAGRPLLVGTESTVELTRRVRNDFTETGVTWPARPRVLFAWASPPGAGEVPHEEHLVALRHSLEAWLPVPIAPGDLPDSPAVLSVLPEATLPALKEACEASLTAKAGPFTHVHLLAHGTAVGPVDEERFGIALHTKEGELDAVPPETLAEALASLCGRAMVVTLATCDAANEANVLIPEKSIAHELHAAGFPVVVASQLPLTVHGSTVMVERFYRSMMAGRDVRTALHEARCALYENQAQTGHDWMSMVGYVRLPEGYAEHLKEVRLQAVMSSLRTAQNSSDELVKSDEGPPEVFDRIARLLGERIAELDTFRNDPDVPTRPGVIEENLGLLGSAEKRLAELHFERARRSGEDKWRSEMFGALRRSLGWYRQGFERNLSHHWTGVQCLSLEAVLDGRIEDPFSWHAAVKAAKTAARNEKEFWALGSLAELYLLAPLASQTVAVTEGNAVLEEMKKRVPPGDGYPLETTERQLRRYTSWWTKANGFFAERPDDLASGAERLIQIIGRG